MGPIASPPKELLIKGGTIYDPVSGKTTRGDIAVKAGKLVEPANLNTQKAEILDAQGALVTHGLIDIHAHFREPGREDKESLESGSRAATAGGFTRVAVMPNTEPAIDSPEMVHSLLEKADHLPIQLYVIGAVSRGREGIELAELLEMHAAGAVAFSDDGSPIADGQLLRRALRYTHDLGTPIINHAEDLSLRDDGVMNESALSTRLGLPGNPVQAEAAMVHRDLLVAQETRGRMHVPHVSTALAVDLVRRFKADGVMVTAEATPHHLGLTEDALRNFDTNAKVAPPLRTEKDREAIVEGLLDGTLDCIASDHAPHTVEDKERDMISAPFGMIGLESAYGLANTVLSRAGMTPEKVIDLFTVGPARAFGLELTPLQPGSPAELVVLRPDETWTFTDDDIYSRSRNTPILGKSFTGRVIATITSRGWYRLD